MGARLQSRLLPCIPQSDLTRGRWLCQRARALTPHAIPAPCSSSMTFEPDELRQLLEQVRAFVAKADEIARAAG